MINMFCPYCGAGNQDNAVFCSSCGRKLSVDGSIEFITDEQPLSTGKPKKTENTGMGMGWHKFLIYFALWLGALINLSSAIQVLTGAHYGDSADAVYAMFPGMKILDIVYGLIGLAVVVFTIYTRFSLARFKKDGPRQLLLLYVLSFASALLYTGGASLVVGSSLFTAKIISSLVGSVVMVAINLSYYEKREYMFIN